MQAISHCLLHQQPRSCAAYLPLIEPNCINQAFYRAVKIGIIKHDEGGFSPQFKSELFAAACGGLANFAPHIGGSGKGNLIDIRVVHQMLAHGAIAGDDVYNSVWHAGLHTDFGE